MLTNATLLRIDTAGISAGGDRTFADGAAISARCLLDEPTYAQKWMIDAAQLSSTLVMYVAKSELPAGTAPAVGGQVMAELDGESSPGLYRVERVMDRVLDGLSHFECFVRAA